MTTLEPIYLRDYKVPDYLIDTVDLTFELGDEATFVTSKLVIFVNPAANTPHHDLTLYGEGLELLSIAIDGKKLESSQYDRNSEQLTIFNVPDRFNCEIVTRIYPHKNTALSGLYQSLGNFCTQCEPHGFRRITYYLDRPDVMARFKTTVIADATKYPHLLSNGNCITTKKLENGQHLATWEDPFKKPCYLFALVAGNFELLEDQFVTQSGRTVDLKIYVEQGNKDKCHHAMQSVKKAMKWDEEHFGREYDLDTYMIVAVSDFNMGAMENKGLNIFNTQYILAKPETATDTDYVHIESVIAHEYCHNWTGNRITCRDWFQLSLKEGLTIFRDQSFTADTTSQTVARINDVDALRNSQFPEDAGPLAHPVQPDSYVEINNFYTATVYNKGAEVIRMQQTILGNDLFRKGMDLYFTRHDGQAVTIEEFVRSMEDASEIDLQQFRLWYKQAGTPEIEIHDEYDAKNQRYILHMKQFCPPTPNQPIKKPFHIPIKMGLISQQGNEILTETLHLKNQEQIIQFDHIKEKPIPSLLRGFSAPVKLNFPYSDDQLLFLFEHDTDMFNRWEAGQRFALRMILQGIQEYHANQSVFVPDSYINLLRKQLNNKTYDPLFLTEILTLPSEKYIAEQMPVIDTDAIHVVREAILQRIANDLKEDFIHLYEANKNQQSASFNMQEMGKRQLKNLSLAYLSLLEDQDIVQRYTLPQFHQALKNNMTDAISALHCIVNSEVAPRKDILEQFYKHWQQDALVLDKWFALQATSKLPNTLEQVKQLTLHPSFDIKNPNKVYSLIGAFGHRNLVCFHNKTGEGYRFLANFVIQLDALNPQVAARMLKPLSDWRRFDGHRQMLMQEQLSHIQQSKKLSNDVKEIVMKSLGE